MSKLDGHIQVGLYMKARTRDSARSVAKKLKMPFYAFVEKAVLKAIKKAKKKLEASSGRAGNSGAGKPAQGGKSAGADGGGAKAKNPATAAKSQG